MGPSDTAAPVMAPQTPKATPRSRPRKLWPRRASEVENITAPPTPWALRDTMSMSGDWANPHNSEPSVKMINPIENNSRRP